MCSLTRRLRWWENREVTKMRTVKITVAIGAVIALSAILWLAVLVVMFWPGAGFD